MRRGKKRGTSLLFRILNSYDTLKLLLLGCCQLYYGYLHKSPEKIKIAQSTLTLISIVYQNLVLPLWILQGSVGLGQIK